MSYKDPYYSARARHFSPEINAQIPQTPPPISNGHSSGAFSINSNGNGQEWNCSECTYLNQAHKKKCDMCLTPRPKPIKTVPLNSNGNGNNNNIIGTPKRPKGIKFSTYDSPISPNSPSLSSVSKNYPNYHHRRHEDQTEYGKVPEGSILPPDISWNPKKPVSKQSVFERWMIAQIERSSGQQPAICVVNNVLLTNLRRVRAPTTHYTIQQQIDTNTNVFAHSNNLDAGDFTDDEEEDVCSLYFYIYIICEFALVFSKYNHIKNKICTPLQTPTYYTALSVSGSITEINGVRKWLFVYSNTIRY